MADRSAGDPAVPVWALQIVYLALLGGMVIYGIVVLTMQSAVSADAQVEQMMLWLLRAAGGATILAGLIVPQVLLRTILGALGRRIEQDDEDHLRQSLLATFAQARIIAAAVPEGAGLLFGTVGLLSGEQGDVAVMAIPALMILMSFPTQSRLETMIRNFFENAELRRREY